MKGYVRHYTGVINIAFHSTLSPEEFAAQNLGPVGCITNRFLIS